MSRDPTCLGFSVFCGCVGEEVPEGPKKRPRVRLEPSHEYEVSSPPNPFDKAFLLTNRL